MQTIITPNPFTDPISSVLIARLAMQMDSELRVYKGVDAPTHEQLKRTQENLQSVFYKNLYEIGKYSLTQGCKEVGIIQPVSFEHELIQTCKDRAAFAAETITKTTGVAFGVIHAALSKKGAVGKKRSKSASKFEGSRIFFEQRTKTWRRKHGVRKKWYCADDPCDICQENEDEGPISIDEEFPSGDYAPAAHINCECLMSLIF